MIDHPSAQWRPSPNFDRRPPATPIVAVVLHATAGAAYPSLNWLTNPNSKVSAHYLISRGGELFQLVQEAHRAWHAGASWHNGRGDWNDFSIGIELVNANDGKDPYTIAQVATLVALLRGLVARYGITRDWIATHAQIAMPRGRKSDPAGLDVEMVLRAVYHEPARIDWRKVTWFGEDAVRRAEAEGLEAEALWMRANWVDPARARRDAA